MDPMDCCYACIEVYYLNKFKINWFYDTFTNYHVSLAIDYKIVFQAVLFLFNNSCLIDYPKHIKEPVALIAVNIAILLERNTIALSKINTRNVITILFIDFRI